MITCGTIYFLDSATTAKAGDSAGLYVCGTATGRAVTTP
jgi:hypothetical protein